MRSKTSCFNRTVFCKNLTRYWPVWAAYLLIWLLILPMSVNNELRWGGSLLNNVSLLELRDVVLDLTGTAGPIMSVIFGVIAAMAVYNYMYSHRSASWTHALPIRREGLFVSNYLSGLCFLLMPNVVAFVVTLIVEASWGLVDLVGLLTWLGAVSLGNVFFFSFATLCAQLTGHVLVLPAVYAVLNFVVVAVEYLARTLFHSMIYGANFSVSRLSLCWGSPLIKLLSEGSAQRIYETAPDGVGVSNTIVAVEFHQWPALLVYLVVAAVMVVCALVLYRRRHTETAGDVVAVPPLKPVFRYCMGFGMAISLGLLLCEIFGLDRSYGMGRLLRMLPCLLVAAFIGYFAAEMLIKKSLRVFKKGLPGFLVCCVVIVAALVLVESDVTGFETRIPDTAEVESVSVYLSGNVGDYMNFEDPADIDRVRRLHSGCVAYKDELEHTRVDYNWGNTVYENARGCRIELDYHLVNGEVLSREYWILSNEENLQKEEHPVALAQQLINCDSAVEARLAFSHENTVVVSGTVYLGEQTGVDWEEILLDQLQAQRLYQAALEDMRAGRLGRINLLEGIVALHNGVEYEDDELDCRVVIEARYEYVDASGEVRSSIEHLHLPLSRAGTVSLAVLEELVGPVYTVQEHLAMVAED